MGSSLESGEAEAFFAGVQHPERAIVSAYQQQRALQNGRGHFAKIRTRVERVGDLKQCLGGLGFTFLVVVNTRVLIANRQLHRD